MSLPTVIYAFSVAIGLLMAGWQLITRCRRPLLGAGAMAHRHRKVPGQTVGDRRPAWHEFRMGMLIIFGGAIGIASKYDTPPGWLAVLVTGFAVVLVWDSARWLRYRQQRHAGAAGS